MRFKNDRTQSLYESINNRIEIHQKSADEAEEDGKYSRMVDRISRMEELDWIVVHLKRLFKFSEINEKNGSG